MNGPEKVTADDGARRFARVLGEIAVCDDFGRLRRLARRARKLEGEVGPPPGLRSLAVALLGGATGDFLRAALDASLLSRRLRPRWHEAPFGTFLSELVDPASASASFGPDLALVLPTVRDLPFRPEVGDDAAALDRRAVEAAEHLLTACAAFRERTGAAIVLGLLPVPGARAAGHLGTRQAEDEERFFTRVHLAVGDRCPAGVTLVDLPGLAARTGLDNWFDRRLWYEARQPVALEALPRLARHLAGVIAAARGASRKLLVLDLDNTLWGGVVGDDGVSGLDLGDGSPAGEAYKDFQRFLLRLARRGVLLAVCSKNDPARVEEAFAEHPEMVLSLDDFVAVKASFDPKSRALRALARELDLGLDAFVFVDDNPAEREEVRRALPQVLVPEIGEDPAAYAALIEDLAVFEAVEVTAEDRERTGQYRRRARAQALERDLSDGGADYDAFLRSLGMRAQVAPFSAATRARVTQLVNKTNQFNLTTPRLSSEQVAALEAAPDVVTRTVRLRDRFGDHGLVAIAWARVRGTTLEIEAWMMSCRVLRRGVEDVMLESLAAAARALGLERLHGRWVPTERNAMVRDLYSGYGFRPSGAEGPGESWELDLASVPPCAAAIEVTTEGEADERSGSDLDRGAPRVPRGARGRRPGLDAGEHGA